MSQDESQPILQASLHDLRYFTTLLRGVHFPNIGVQRAVIKVTEKGLVVIVEEARSLLGTSYIFADVFNEWNYHPDISSNDQEQENEEQTPLQEQFHTIAFEIPLSTLIECLNIFGTAGGFGSTKSANKVRLRRTGEDSDDNNDDDANRSTGRSSRSTGRTLEHFFGGSDRTTSMRMTYIGPGYPLTLIIAEDSAGPTTTCEISTSDSEEHLDLPFDNDQMVLRIILKSSWLRDALSELDPSCEKITFIGNPPVVPDSNATAKQKMKARLEGKPIFRLEATGTFGSTEMDYPDDKEVLESFECVQPVRFSYRLALIARAARALQSSIKTSLRIDNEGLLSLQFLMPSPTSRHNARADNATSNFIEYRCLAIDED
ncbi:Rad1-domain-containing protein [Dendrothele bispora CBS 962.96]|uniref:Rad1-domain-containing protein n=1 Tax=Dendrothele bispora (strain CBS 962.96) TaxID=1314807 RepID=A0A4V4HFV0_DENBC|nr:Rad1-domain-containing protein [Dendrothele bispora CBS 962.96]